MLCYVMLCYATLRNATLRNVTLRYATLRYVMLCYVMLYYVMLCYSYHTYARNLVLHSCQSMQFFLASQMSHYICQQLDTCSQTVLVDILTELFK